MEENISVSVIKLCEENSRIIINGSEALKKIKCFLRHGGYSPDAIREIFLQPDSKLGAFDKLPQCVRSSFSNSAYFHIQESHRLSSSVIRVLAYGPLYKLGGYIIHKGWKLRVAQFGLMHFLFVLVGRKLIGTCRILNRIFLRLFRFTRFYKAPFPHMLWIYIGINPWYLIHNYIKEIPVNPILCPVFKCVRNSIMSCALIGIDLLPSCGKLYFLESNFNVGHYMDRHMLFPDGDTVCNHLVEWAVKNGFIKIIFFPSNFQSNFDKNLEDAWRKIAEKNGIALEIIDDANIGSPWPRSRRIFMDLAFREVVYVNGRYINDPLSRLIGQKGLLDNEIRRFNNGVQSNKKIPIPRIIHSIDDVPWVDNETIFPNIIIKNACMDQTKGIILYNARHFPAEANSWPNIAYEYLTPDLELKKEGGFVNKYAFIFRAYLLITPDGPIYLGARKDVSSVPIPNALPFGIIKDKSPYITNYYLGAHFVAHSKKEDEACRDVVLSIGKVIYRFLTQKHLLIVE